MSDAETIAASLTKAQRHEVRWGRFPALFCELRGHRTRSALVREGLCEFRHVIAGRGDYYLTPLGLAVKAIIEGAKE